MLSLTKQTCSDQNASSANPVLWFYAYVRKKDLNFLAVIVCTFFIYGFVKKDLNFVRSFYLLFEGAVTCRILFVDTTLATTALSKHV